MTRGKHVRRESLPIIDANAAPIANQADSVTEGFFEGPSAGVVAMPKKQPVYIRLIVATVCALALVGGGAAFAAIMSGIGPDEPEIVEPETVQATVKVDGILIPGPTLQRGDELQNIAPADELTGGFAGQYYRADFGGQTVYVPKKWVRTAEEAAPEQWTGFAAQDAIIFGKPDFSGDDILTLGLNEEVQVLDSFNGLLYVKNADGAEGYMPEDKVLREKAPAASTAKPSSGSSSSKGNSSSGSNKKPSSGSSSSKPSGGTSGSGSSSGSTGGGSSSGSGGSSGSGSSGGSNSGGSDGEDMGLPTAVAYVHSAGRSILGVEFAYADEPADAQADKADQGSGLTGVVLADGIAAHMGMMNRGDAVTVKVDEKLGPADALTPEEIAALSPEEKAELGTVEDVCTVIINGQEFELAEKYLRFETDDPYEIWDGFAIEGAVAYTDYQMTANPRELEKNAAIHVVDFIENALIVEIEGETYFMDASAVSKEEIVDEEEPAEEAARPSSNSSGSSASSNKKPSSGSSSSKPSSGTSGSGSSSGSTGGGSSSGSGGSSGSSSSGGSNSGGSGSGGSGGTTAPEPEWSAPAL